ncbi:hypothetical protein AB4Z48_15155 [Cupriavidus sp. 2TAF22]|uniref:hypothetical protein n=1 Tax=unclassified Cupriavidus TaxID=2640874 RepID=UPI003F911165
MPLTHGRALPGSGGEVIVVDLPGHAAGHPGAFIQGKRRRIVRLRETGSRA